jgi:serine/threonine protein phosphatase PrpC
VIATNFYCIVDEAGRLVYSHSLTVHTAANPDELRRIADGIADSKDPHVRNGRIANGSLAMTRAFGDLELTGFGLSPEPDVKQFKLAPGNTVVLHTDGVNLTAEQIAELVHGNRETPCDAVAAIIVAKAAEDPKNKDDITALVLRP